VRPFFLLLGMILHESQPKSICLEAVICTYGQIFAVCQNNWTITLANLRLVWQLTIYCGIYCGNLLIYCGICCGVSVAFLWRLKVCGVHYRFGIERTGMIIVSEKKQRLGKT
jgi:hypothetical protein